MPAHGWQRTSGTMTGIMVDMIRTFAGEFETALDVHSDEMIRAAIHTVRRSRHSERVRAYSEAKGEVLRWHSLSDVSPVLSVTGWILIIVGLASLFITMAGFGLRRSLGQEVNVLKQSGFYRLSRNPQIVASALAVIGYAMLWPSWHTLGWVVLYGAVVVLQ